MPTFRKISDLLLPADMLRPAMFFVVGILLALHLPNAGNYPPYGEMEDGLGRAYQWHLKDRDMLYAEMLEDTLDIRPDTVLRGVRNIRQHTIRVLESIDGFKDRKLCSADLDSIQSIVDDYCRFLAPRFPKQQYLSMMVNVTPVFSFSAYDLGFERGRYAIREILRTLPVYESKLTLAALQNMMLISEYIFLLQIYLSSVPGCVVGFDAFECISIPDKSFLLPGQKIKAFVALTNYNKALVPEVQTDKGQIDKVENGVARWSGKSSALGEQVISGTLAITRRGETIVRPWSFQYMVVEKGISMELDNANVCYAGVANPVSISVPGYAPEALSLRVEGAKVNKTSPGNYVLMPGSNDRELYAYVDARNAIGEVSTVAGRKLYVHEVPPPQVYISGSADGSISTVQINNIVAIPPEDIDLTYKVSSYTIVCIRGGEVLGEVRNGDTGTLVQTLIAGDKLIYTDLEVVGSNGIIYYPAPISYMLQ